VTAHEWFRLLGRYQIPGIRVQNPPIARPLLVFDGECLFCRRMAERIQATSDGGVGLEPAKTAAARFPDIAAAEFERSVKLIGIDGRVFSAAEAILRARAACSRSWLLLTYKHVPLAAAILEAVYRLAARNRFTHQPGGPPSK
jgi:predicted DCC family thiol-disulfide oxidoreductase YuxK